VADENPWRTLSSATKYENDWIRVTEHQVLAPSGKPGIYGTVHFKHLAIGVLPVDTEGNLWLVGQHRFPLGRYSWEIIAGGGEPDLDPLESARRELKEEAGIEAANWRRILDLDLSNSVTDQHGFVYLATGLSFGQPEPDDTEALTLRRVPLDEAVAMALDGRITQALSVAAILRLKLLLLDGSAAN
jgi:8-oxo-dGTP pyrophosphatase MutT (NUDIX family)